MGNIITPQSQSKNAKLKGILFILRQQQTKLKNHRRQCTNKINASNRKLKYFLLHKSKSDFHDMMIDENIQECAEEIFHQKKKLLDLKACYDILNCLQYKVQNIMDAYYTHTTIQNVNNSIRDSNMNLQNEVQFDNGMSCMISYRCTKFLVCHYLEFMSIKNGHSPTNTNTTMYASPKKYRYTKSDFRISKNTEYK